MQQTAYTNARIIDPLTGLDTLGTLLVGDSTINAVGAQLDIPADAKVIDCGGRILCPGLIDMRSHAVDWKAAAKGGFTAIALQPDQTTIIDTDAEVERICRKSLETGTITVHPIAAATRGMRGSEITEIGQMQASGAVGFTDCSKPIADAMILSRLLEYAGHFDALVIQFPEEASLKGSGIAHDGVVSARLGLSGIPALAEVIQIDRDSRIAQDKDCRLHFSLLSSRDGVDAVRQAKARGAKVTCSVAAHHLHLNENELEGFPTFTKVSPPLRSEEDRLALIEGVSDGTIDTIVSDHMPQHEDKKRLPFAQATDGIIGYETALSIVMSLVHAGSIDLITALKALTLAPATILGTSGGTIAVGKPADLTIFDPDAPWIVDRTALLSPASNTPFDNKPMQAVVWKTIVGGNEIYAQEG